MSDTVKKYLELYKASTNGQIDYSVTIQGDLTLINCPPFILWSLAENCIKHGLDTNADHMFIEAQAKTDGNHTVITVSDNGKGMPSGALETIKLVFLISSLYYRYYTR